MKARILTYFTPTGDGQRPEPGFYFSNAEPRHIVEGLELLCDEEQKLGRENGSLKKVIEWLVQSEAVDLSTAVALREFLDYNPIDWDLPDGVKEYPFGFREVEKRWGAERRWSSLPAEVQLKELRMVPLTSTHKRQRYRAIQVLQFGGCLNIPDHSVQGMVLLGLGAHAGRIVEDSDCDDTAISEDLIDTMFATADHYLTAP